MADRLKLFTEEEKMLAEKNHDLVYQFLRAHNYNMEDYYNIIVSCYACNQFKSNIRPEDFEQKIIDIFLYQMKQKCANDWVWKIIEKIILKRLDK